MPMTPFLSVVVYLLAVLLLVGIVWVLQKSWL